MVPISAVALSVNLMCFVRRGEITDGLFPERIDLSEQANKVNKEWKSAHWQIPASKAGVGWGGVGSFNSFFSLSSQILECLVLTFPFVSISPRHALFIKVSGSLQNLCLPFPGTPLHSPAKPRV